MEKTQILLLKARLEIKHIPLLCRYTHEKMVSSAVVTSKN